MDSEEYFVIVVGDVNNESIKTTDLSNYSGEAMKLLMKQNIKIEAGPIKDESSDDHCDIKEEKEENSDADYVATENDFLECPTCFAKVKSTYLKRHIKRVHEKKEKPLSPSPQKLEECPLCSAKVKLLRQHMYRQHGRKKRILSEHGSDSEDTTNSVKKGAWKIKPKCKLLVCPICLATVKSTSLSRHISRQHESKIKTSTSASKELQQCPECPAKVTLLTQHMNRQHGNEKIRSCFICSNTYKTAEAFKAHMNGHLGLKPFKCSDCPKEYTRKSVLQHHQTIHSNVDYICDYCKKAYKRKDHLVEHIKSHLAGKYECKICDKSYSLLSTLKKHILDKHTAVDPGSLKDYMQETPIKVEPTDDQRFADVLEPSVNLTVVRQSTPVSAPATASKPKKSPKPKHQCDYCSKAFKEKEALVKHIQAHFNIYQCDYCGKVFDHNLLLRKHVRAAHKKKRYQCHVCSAIYKSDEAINAHINAHFGRRPYKCPDCPVAYTSKTALRQHRSKHSSVEYICDYCNKSCKRKDNLVEHMKAHTSNSRFICPMCDRPYYLLTSLKKHIQEKHVNPGKNKCQICERTYGTFHVLRDHMMKKHNHNLISQKIFYNMLPKMDLNGDSKQLLSLIAKK